ncbi:MAG: hypothetical protein IJ083_00940 [Clostridia bacterium]|nr:hypothetical protein [Clostridia bacterium]
MREILISVMPVTMWVLTALNLALTLSLFLLWRKRKLTSALWMGLVAFGLFYDALILSLGTVLPEGSLLQGLSLPRFVLHCGLIPLLFPICAEGLGLRRGGRIAVWIVTGLIMAVGVAAGFATRLEPQTVGGVIRYASTKGLTPGWSTGIQNALSYGPIIVLMVCGVIVWILRKRPELFLSGLAMFIFSALAPATGNMDLMFFISMFGEVLMVFFFWLYGKKRQGADK